MPNVVRWLGADDGHDLTSGAAEDSLRGRRVFIPDTERRTGFIVEGWPFCRVGEEESRVYIMVRTGMRCGAILDERAYAV
jgi:hypothetical protein